MGVGVGVQVDGVGVGVQVDGVGVWLARISDRHLVYAATVIADTPSSG